MLPAHRQGVQVAALAAYPVHTEVRSLDPAGTAAHDAGEATDKPLVCFVAHWLLGPVEGSRFEFEGLHIGIMRVT